VGRIDLDAVAALPGTPECIEAFNWVRGWLEDDTRYEAVPIRSARHAPTPDFSEADVQALLDYGSIARIRRNDVRGHVHMFTVDEPHKERRRIIKHTVDVNNVLGKETLLPVKLPTKREIADLVWAGDSCITLDFSAYYDQLRYADDVATRFCFRVGSDYYRLVTMSMGQRQTTDCASHTTARFLDYEKQGATRAIIDGAAFAGSTSTVVRDSTIYRDRALACGATFNEDVSDLSKLVVHECDFGGVHLNFIDKTTCLTQKVVDKVKYSWSLREHWTWRGFASHAGLLFWSWQLIELPMAEFYPLLRFIGEISRKMTFDELVWDEPAVIPDSVWPSLALWTGLAQRNRPMRVNSSNEPRWIVATDASSWGWGYCAINVDTNELHTHGEPWSPAMHEKYGDLLGKSTFTEPQALLNAMVHLLPVDDPCIVRVLTDNTPTKYTFRRGFSSRSYHLNECARRLREHFGPDFYFDVEYIPGEENPADAYSRGYVEQCEEP